VRRYWARLKDRAGFRRAIDAQDAAARAQGVSTAASAEK
jgi:glutathione S-transferase